MADQNKERRRFKRYNTDVEIYFDFIYDLETKVEFSLIDKKKKKVSVKKYAAVSRNISVGGLCIASSKKVKQEDLLHLEVYLPSADDPIQMKGQVEWCKPVPPTYEQRILEEMEGHRVYEIGIRLLFVKGESVDASIHHDALYDVDWGVALETVFGNYKTLMEGKYKSDK